MDTMEEKVVLVNVNDEVLGEMPKLEAHEKSLLHRAFSVFVFNSKGEMLLQQRAASKYHSPNLWTNACCSHPRLEESYEKAAQRRLQEELGIEASVKHLFQFIYEAEVGNGLYEHELDHVFSAQYEGDIPFNHEEVQAIQWMTVHEVMQDMKQNKDQYTVWFQIIFDKFLNFFLDESQLV